MTIGTSFPLVQEERSDEPNDFNSARGLTPPDFSPSRNEPLDSLAGNTIQADHPKERTGAVEPPWSVARKAFGVLSRLVSGEGQASAPDSSVHLSDEMRVSVDHTPASNPRSASALRVAGPVFRKWHETRARHTAAQEYVADHRDESVPQPIPAAPMGATAMRPIGKLGHNITRAIGRWQGKLPAVHIAFLTQPARAQKEPARTPGTDDERVPGPAAPSEMPATNSSTGNTAQAEAAIPPGDATVVRPRDLRFPITGGIELATRDRMATTTSPAHGWPVLNLLPRLEAIVTRGARASEPSRRIADAIPALQSLPALGPGEPLVEPVKPMMEKLTGRDLSQVRIYSSPAAEALGAEAFTSGQRIVFAPGRLDLRSSRGLALLGHELAHLGQPLALKSNWMDTLSNVEERVALDQESALQRLFESGEITPPRMDLLRVAIESRPAERSTGAESGTAVHGELDSAPLQMTDFANAEPVLTSQTPPGTVYVPSTQTADVPAAAPSSPNATSPSTLPSNAPDVDALARKVYDLLKDQLRSERERHELYSR